MALLLATTAAVLSTLVAAPPAAAAPGDLDVGFGTGGIVEHNVGPAATLDAATAIAAQPDGKVLVAGIGAGGLDVVVLRLTASGIVDTTFGTNGVFAYSASSGNDYATGVQVAPDGKIVVVGYSLVGPTSSFLAFRLLPNGALDSTFDDDGVKIGFSAGVSNVDLVPTALAVLADGAFYVVGGLGSSSATSAQLVRFRADGTLDPTFGTNGRLTINHPVLAMTLWPDARPVLAGSTVSSTPAMVVTRVTPDGAMDPFYGTNGEVIFAHPANSDIETAAAVTVDRGGHVVAGGAFFRTSDSSAGFLLQRTYQEGAIDTTFGTSGRVRTTTTGGIRALTSQADGRILAVGGLGNGTQPWVVARYNEDGTPDTTFDVDGLAPAPAGVLGYASGVVLANGAAYVAGSNDAFELTIARYDVGGATPFVTSPYGNREIGSFFQSMTPRRVLDTRAGGAATKIGEDGRIDVRVAGGTLGFGGNATAVVVNITATEARAPGYVAVWPAGTAQPNVSSLNLPAAGATVANLVTVPLDRDVLHAGSGFISIYSEHGTHVIVDVLGFYVPVASMTNAGRFTPLAPFRLRDTRADGAAPGQIDVPLGSVPGLPAGQAAAVVVNLTVTGASQQGYVTAWPANEAQPSTSNLNVDGAQQTRANQAIASYGNGTLRLANTSGGHLLVDVIGYITSANAPLASTGLFVPSTPARVWDTRTGTGTVRAPLAAGEHRDLALGTTDLGSTAIAIAGNLTATESAAPGYVALWPSSTGPRPDVSTINLDLADQTRANHVTVPLGTAGHLSVFSDNGTHIILDVFGTYRR